MYKVLVCDDEKDIVSVSRAALYRHIANMNEKTQTKARMGLYSSITAGRVKNSDFMGLLTF